MLSLTASIAMDSILMGVRAYGIYGTASDIYNGNWDSLAEDMVLNMVSGKLLSGIYNTLSQFKFMQNMGKRFQSIIDRLKGCNSFDGTTLVATENGLVPIEEIKIGDKVWAYNEANQTKSLQEVTHLIRGEGDKELVDITLSSGEVIIATANHPFWEVNTQEWLDANELNTTTVLLDINDKNSTIKSLKHYQKESKVYNLTVANVHTYYVGFDGVLGHNADDCPDWMKGHDVPDTKPSLWDGKLSSIKKREIFADGYGIDKVDAIVENIGGDALKWKKIKGFTPDGQEWHWYELDDVFDPYTKEIRVYAKKKAGEIDPPWKDW